MKRTASEAAKCHCWLFFFCFVFVVLIQKRIKGGGGNKWDFLSGRSLNIQSNWDYRFMRILKRRGKLKCFPTACHFCAKIIPSLSRDVISKAVTNMPLEIIRNTTPVKEK